ncbi:hypothetical protein WA026_003175 [Henosepilachna vigintioctopunctata]|uniref:Uncharacterized protein n=1 Tax=Henosepilachna vigintioctopunctata TaxID=420089 RepID=A0AAW1TML7_9CUCU
MGERPREGTPNEFDRKNDTSSASAKPAVTCAPLGGLILFITAIRHSSICFLFGTEVPVRVDFERCKTWGKLCKSNALLRFDDIELTVFYCTLS